MSTRDDEEAAVEPFYDAFLAVHDEITARGEYPYDDSFTGRIPGLAELPIVGARGAESRAIYLLQNMRRRRSDEAKRDAFLADGAAVVTLDDVTEEPAKYAIVAEFGWYMGGSGWRTWERPRLLRYGRSMAVLPKGKRVNGHILSGTVLAKPL